MSPTTVKAAAAALSSTTAIEDCLPCERQARLRELALSRRSTFRSARDLPGSGARGKLMPADAIEVITDEDGGTARWEGVVGVEGEMTGDGRLIQPNALRWDDLPIPLRYVGADVGAHQGAEVVGRILSLERREGGLIWGSGDFDLESELGKEAARKVDKKLMQGVSMDLDDVAFEVRIAAEAAQLVVDGMQPLNLENPDADGRVSIKEVSPDDEVMVTTGARVRAATIVAVPAFSRAKISLVAAGAPAPWFARRRALLAAARVALSVTPEEDVPPQAVCAHEGCTVAPVFAVSTNEPGIEVLYCGEHAGEHEDGPLPPATLDLLSEPALAAEMVLAAFTPPPFVETIAAALVTRGREPATALSTALSTVARWAGGGSVSASGGGAVDARTAARAAEALAALEGADSEGTFNWVEDVGGLPKKIREIADAIMKKGTPEGHAIAIAVNAVKKGCATGDVNFPGKQNMNPASRAQYCAAAAEWEAKRAASKASAGVAMPLADGWTLFRDYTKETREKQAAAGEAMPDGSYPVANCQDLRNAIQAIGRASDPEAVKKHIAKRKSALGCEDVDLPETWALTALTAAGGKDQWRNPANGRWVDMPDIALGKLLGDLDAASDDPDSGFAWGDDESRDQLEGVVELIKNSDDQGKLDRMADAQTVLDDLEPSMPSGGGEINESFDKTREALDAFEQGFIPGEASDIGAGDEDGGEAGLPVAERSDWELDDTQDQPFYMHESGAGITQADDGSWYKVGPDGYVADGERGYATPEEAADNVEADAGNLDQGPPELRTPLQDSDMVDVADEPGNRLDDMLPEGGNSIADPWKTEDNQQLSEEQWQAADAAQLHPGRLAPGPSGNLVRLKGGNGSLEGMFDPDTGALYYLQNNGDWIQYGPEEGPKPPGGMADFYPKQTNHGKTPPWEGESGGVAAGDGAFPADEIPEGWEVGEEGGQSYLSGPPELGEAGLIAVSTEDGPFEPGQYWLPGQAEDQQGPFDSLEEAVRAAELGNPWGDLPLTERPETDLGPNPDGPPAAGGYVPDPDGFDENGDASGEELARFVQSQELPEGWEANVDPGDPDGDYPASITLMRDGMPVSQERGSTILLREDGMVEWAGSRGVAVEPSLADYIESYLSDEGEPEMTEVPADTGTAREPEPDTPDYVGDGELVGNGGSGLDEGELAEAADFVDQVLGSDVADAFDKQVRAGDGVAAAGLLQDALSELSEEDMQNVDVSDLEAMVEKLQEGSEYSAQTEDEEGKDENEKPRRFDKGGKLRVPSARERKEHASLVAAAPPHDPDAPPEAFFDDPHFKTVAPLTITNEGRVMGHLATWGSCHLTHTARGKCVTPPRSPSGYAYFNTGHVLTKEGREVAVGQLTLDTGHADEAFSAKRALAHYDNTGLAVADVSVGEDSFGIWFSGALRPGITALAVRKLRASPLSGDWRRLGGALELVAALAVNVQGYPVPRPSGRVRQGEMISLVAAGMVPPSRVTRPGTPGALSTDDLRYLKRLAARERDAEHEAQAATLSRAADLARRLAAADMASRVASSVSAMNGDTTSGEGEH